MVSIYSKIHLGPNAMSCRCYAALLVLLLLFGNLMGCSTLGNKKQNDQDLVQTEQSQVEKDDLENEENDPFERFNRAMFKFNDKLDRGILKPVASGYQKITPRPIRLGVRNFFNNLREPTTIINDILQGKVEQTIRDTIRFFINTTFGLLGLIDFASLMDLERNKEDFGQTFAKWGFSEGPYLVLPFLGPSNVRDGLGLIPFYRYTDPRVDVAEGQIYWGMIAVDVISTRAELLTASKVLDLQLDPYLFVRESYRQLRRNEIYDGDPPPEDDPDSF